MNDSPIKDTTELLRFAGAAFRKYKDLMEDGKFSGVDGIKMAVSLAGSATDGVFGIQNVGDELLSMDAASQEQLSQIIAEELISVGVTHRNAERSIMWLAWLVQGAQLWKIDQNLPPTAEPA